MRALLPGLPSPQPLGPALPSLYQGDDLAQRFMSAFDEVMSPVYSTLQNLDAYLDPHLAPADFLAWLAGWVGVVFEDDWSVERRRTVVAGAAELYRWRGTVRGVAAAVALTTGLDPEIEESGAIGWSAIPGTAVPGTPVAAMVVRVHAPGATPADLARLEAVVRAAKPAHVAHRVEVTG